MNGVVRYYKSYSCEKNGHEIFDRKTSTVIEVVTTGYDDAEKRVNELNKAERGDSPNAIELPSTYYGTKNRTNGDVEVETPKVHK